jgi:uncharacterized protein YbjT (DUF2867 family)
MVERAGVAVVGATGLLGSTVCARLRDDGEVVCALVRPTSDPVALARLEGLGVEIIEGDVEAPETLDACFAGVEAVVSTASAFPRDPRPDALERVDLEGQLAVVAAAERAGVRRLVYLSFPPIAFDFAFQRAKRAVEERLLTSTLEAVVLQPAKFMDVWFTPPLGFDVDGTVTLYGGGTAQHPWVAVADVAEVIARVLRVDDAAGRTLAFGGPGSLGLVDGVGVFEQALGRPIATTTVPVEELGAMRERATSPLDDSIGAVLLDATVPQRIPPSPYVAELGLQWTSVEDLAARWAQASRVVGR